MSTDQFEHVDGRSVMKLKGKLGSPRGLVETKSAVPPAGVDLSKAKSTPLGSPHGRNKECSSPRRC